MTIPGPRPGKSGAFQTDFRCNSNFDGVFRAFVRVSLGGAATLKSAGNAKFLRHGSCHRRRASRGEGRSFPADHGWRICGWRNRGI